jgi:TolB protein
MRRFRIPILSAVLAIPALLLASGCATPAYVPGTVHFPPVSPSSSPTCQGILCTPDAGNACSCDICADTGSATAGTPTRTPDPTIPSGANFTPPSLLAERGMLAVTLRNGDYAHIWLWPLGLPNPIALTNGDFNDRDPAFRPDGGALAFASQRGGNWDLYVLDLADGSLAQLTDSADFEAHPSWSPDSRQMVYERYINGHFRVSIRRVDDQALMWAGPDGMESYEPSWSPQARTIAFTGRTGTKGDIYLLSLDTQRIVNLTNTPDLDERQPAFSPDGASIAYAVEQNGYSWIYRITASGNPGPGILVGQGDHPEWSPDGKWLAGVYQPDPVQSYLLFTPSDRQVLSPSALWLPGRIEKLAWTNASLSNPPPDWIAALSGTPPGSIPTPPAGTPMSAQLVDIGVNAPDPRLSSAVVERFQSLRAAVKKQSGWDFLGTLDSAVVGINTLLPPKETLSWLRTGRAFAIARAAISKGWLVVVPDPIGTSAYWRLYIRAAVQDGSQGEPLRELPWDFDARTSGTPSALDNGGQSFTAIPVGYYVDFSQLASGYGFQRIASEPDWRTYYFGIHYWEFVCADGLDWFSAMGELYSPYAYLTPTPSNTPTFTPTYRWGPPLTNTPTPSRTPSPTPTVA